MALSSTIGAEMTAPKVWPALALLVISCTAISLAVLIRKAKKTATSAPKKRGCQHPGRLSFVTINPKHQHEVDGNRQCGRHDSDQRGDEPGLHADQERTMRPSRRATRTAIMPAITLMTVFAPEDLEGRGRTKAFGVRGSFIMVN